MIFVVLYMMVAGAFAGWWLARQGLLAKPWLEQGCFGEREAGCRRQFYANFRPARVSGRSRKSLRSPGQRLPDEDAGSRLATGTAAHDRLV